MTAESYPAMEKVCSDYCFLVGYYVLIKMNNQPMCSNIGYYNQNHNEDQTML